MNHILHLIEQYGFLLILLGVMLESTGIPLPGETILIAAGILVQRGTLGFWEVVLFGVLGAVMGDQLGYWIGRKGGRPFILKWGRYVRITPDRLSGAERFFARHGGKAVFLARFFSGLRIFGALVAGVSRMHWRTFFFYNALGSVVWTTAVVLIGYLLGGSLKVVERWTGQATLLLGALGVLAVLLYLSYRWAIGHPEQLERTFTRFGGDRLQTFLEGPVGRWLRRRFSPSGAYGLSLTAGLILMGLFSWAFGGIAQDLVNRDPLVRVDVRILEFLHSHAEPTLTTVVLVFDSIFSPELLLISGAVTGAALVASAYRGSGFRKGFSGGVLLAAAFGTGALVELFKVLFHRPRPPASLQLAHETGNSFPSAHAMAAVTIGAAVWYLWSLRSPRSWGGSWRAKTRVGLVVVTVALLVGLGRVYTGAHYPSDVLAGWALGGVWASICLTSAEVFRRLRESGKPLPETGVKYAQFSIVGATNALVDLGTLNLLLLLFPARSPTVLVLYNLVALTLTNTNSYLWNTRWTFKERSKHSAWQVIMFAVQAAIGAGVGTLTLWLVARGLIAYEGLSPLVAGNAAKLVSMVVGSTTSFILLRFFIFRRKGF